MTPIVLSLKEFYERKVTGLTCISCPRAVWVTARDAGGRKMVACYASLDPPT